MTDDKKVGVTGPYEQPMLGIVRALHGTPMLLVLTLVNLITLGMVTYLTTVAAEYRSKERTEILQVLTECLQEIKKRDSMRFMNKIPRKPLEQVGSDGKDK
jgi:hypothetical protein